MTPCLLTLRAGVAAAIITSSFRTQIPCRMTVLKNARLGTVLLLAYPGTIINHFIGQRSGLLVKEPYGIVTA